MASPSALRAGGTPPHTPIPYTGCALVPEHSASSSGTTSGPAPLHRTPVAHCRPGTPRADSHFRIRERRGRLADVRENGEAAPHASREAQAIGRKPKREGRSAGMDNGTLEPLRAGRRGARARGRW